VKWKVTTPLVIYSGLSTTQPADAKVPLSEADMLVNPGVGSVVGGATSPPVPLPEDHFVKVTVIEFTLPVELPTLIWK
jgi:hypothetical protein